MSSQWASKCQGPARAATRRRWRDWAEVCTLDHRLNATQAPDRPWCSLHSESQPAQRLNVAVRQCENPLPLHPARLPRHCRRAVAPRSYRDATIRSRSYSLPVGSKRHRRLPWGIEGAPAVPVGMSRTLVLGSRRWAAGRATNRTFAGGRSGLARVVRGRGSEAGATPVDVSLTSGPPSELRGMPLRNELVGGHRSPGVERPLPITSLNFTARAEICPCSPSTRTARSSVMGSSAIGDWP